MCGELPKLPADKQVLLINTLGYRGDASAGPALLALASKGPDAVRLAAVQNLTHLGYAPALPLLAELSLTGDGDLAAAARTCLGNFPGKDADATILAMLAHKDAKVRSLAVADDRAAEHRRIDCQAAEGRRRRRRDRPPCRLQGTARTRPAPPICPPC